jgi:NAD(P) transhydrogenase subunit beta
METLSTLTYLTSAILFIFALRGLSHPETARRGVLYGMVGMGLAIVTTLFMAVESWTMILVGLAIGGVIGTVTAQKIQMTALPQLVAAFHSLVGLAAVLVAAAAFYNPEAYGIGFKGEILTSSLIEMCLGAAIGAITFTGSLIAFGKLQGIISGKPIMLPQRHVVNIALGAGLIVLIALVCATESTFLFWMIVLTAFALGVLLIVPIGGADMPVIVSMLNSYSGWAAAGIGFTLQNDLLIITGALVGVIRGYSVLHHV